MHWEPSADEITRILGDQNPWHATGAVPQALAREVERPLAQRLWRAVAEPHPRRAHLILGPRRVGKTTVMYQTVRALLRHGLAPDRLWWMRLDHPYLLREDLGSLVRRVIDTAGASSEHEVVMFLDELVYAQDWDRWLKTFHDEGWPVRVVATSSATAALKGGFRESGIGRWDEHQLAPYQLAEYLDLAGVSVPVQLGHRLDETLRALQPGVPSAEVADHRRRFSLIGGFPELLTAVGDLDDESLLLRSQQRLREEAIERAIYKDIPQSFGIDSPLTLERLLYVLAGQATGLLAVTGLAKDLGVAQPTFDRYLSYLEQTFLVFRTMNYAGSEAKVQRRGRKVFFLDGAIRNAALQRGLAPLTDPTEMGLLTENLVASALHALSLQSGHRLYHWREGKHEVDFVLDHPSGPMAFEVSVSPRHSLDGLRHLVEHHPALSGRTYLVAPTSSVRQPDGVGTPGSLPLDLFLIAVGRHAERAAELRLLPEAANRDAADPRSQEREGG